MNGDSKMANLNLLRLICVLHIIILQNAEAGVFDPWNDNAKQNNYIAVRAFGSGTQGEIINFRPYGNTGTLMTDTNKKIEQWDVDNIYPENKNEVDRFRFTREICASGSYLVHQGTHFAGPVLVINSPKFTSCIYNPCLKDVGSIQVLEDHEMVWFNQPNLVGRVHRGAPQVGSKPRSALYFGPGRFDLVYTKLGASESRRTCFEVTPSNTNPACPIMDIYKAMAITPEEYHFKEYSLKTGAEGEKCDFVASVNCAQLVTQSKDAGCSGFGGDNSTVIDRDDAKWTITATPK